jgi:hypothetical protein
VCRAVTLWRSPSGAHGASLSSAHVPARASCVPLLGGSQEMSLSKKCPEPVQSSTGSSNTAPGCCSDEVSVSAAGHAGALHAAPPAAAGL